MYNNVIFMFYIVLKWHSIECIFLNLFYDYFFTCSFQVNILSMFKPKKCVKFCFSIYLLLHNIIWYFFLIFAFFSNILIELLIYINLAIYIDSTFSAFLISAIDYNHKCNIFLMYNFFLDSGSLFLSMIMFFIIIKISGKKLKNISQVF